MSFVITLVSQVDFADDTGSETGSLKLGPVSFGSKVAPIYPYKLTTLVAPGASEVIDLTPLYTSTNQAVRSFTLKSKRPVTITLKGRSSTVQAGVAVDYVLPYSTYWNFIYDTRESDFKLRLDSITINSPVIPTTAPNPTPEGYPGSLVSILLGIEEIS